ncbi:winged helix-turn-helix transcriptional regulator [Actinomadura graeca]|uniref:Winged helix-turn-helix transcriptional regulator n=1 Tax=Actinomadura graeca TaxID=2750812 RepID=A0ABX8QSM4_9ACTN|nr:MarR family winged helix-turn-helix transcriptional regulator [Actinomadura graeca]QXJ21835.1 winged helix-turn-helix transcriptional regulator [Actinomadura graeca]
MENQPFGPLEREEVLSLLLGIARAHYDRLGKEAGRLGLTLPQARVLYFVKTESTVRRLAKRLACDPSYVTGLVDALEGKDLLRREVDAADRRIKKLLLTPEGDRVRTEVIGAMGKSVDLEGLVPDEAAQFAQLLRKIQNDDRTPAW